MTLVGTIIKIATNSNLKAHKIASSTQKLIQTDCFAGNEQLDRKKDNLFTFDDRVHRLMESCVSESCVGNKRIG